MHRKQRGIKRFGSTNQEHHHVRIISQLIRESRERKWGRRKKPAGDYTGFALCFISPDKQNFAGAGVERERERKLNLQTGLEPRGYIVLACKKVVEKHRLALITLELK
jgi:hypothetical protein